MPQSNLPTDTSMYMYFSNGNPILSDFTGEVMQLHHSNGIPKPASIIGKWASSDGTTILTFDPNLQVTLQKSMLYTSYGTWSKSGDEYYITIYNVPAFGTIQGPAKVDQNELTVDWGFAIGRYEKVDV